MPWQIVGNFPQWLELLCFTNGEAAKIFFGWSIGNTISPLIAGLLLNAVARRFPDHGPPTIANFSSGVSAPLCVVMFFLLPRPGTDGATSSEIWSYIVSLFLIGLVVSMCGVVNSKVFADFVPKHLLTYAYAMDTILEGAIGNLGPLAVGFISDKVFHLDEAAAQSGKCQPDVGVALGNSMVTIFMLGWGCCFLVYLGMQCTYPKDRRLLLKARDVKTNTLSDVVDKTEV